MVEKCRVPHGHEIPGKKLKLDKLFSRPGNVLELIKRFREIANIAKVADPQAVNASLRNTFTVLLHLMALFDTVVWSCRESIYGGKKRREELEINRFLPDRNNKIVFLFVQHRVKIAVLRDMLLGCYMEVHSSLSWCVHNTLVGLEIG